MPTSLARPLRDLPQLGAPERHRVLVGFNATARALDHATSTSIVDRILLHASLEPGTLAVIAGEERLTYAELDRASASVASALQAAGVERGALTPILAGRGLDAVIGILGILRAGAAFVPLDPRWPPAHLASLLDRVGARVVVASRSAGALEPLEGRAVITPSLSRDEVEPRSPETVTDRHGAGDEESPVYAMFTSGTTGAPRLAVIPHRGLDNRFAWMDDVFGAPAPVTLQTTPLHLDSSVWQLLWPLTRGGTAVIPLDEPALPASRMIDLVARHGITILDFVPSLFDLAVADLVEGAPRLASLRDVILGGEAIRREPVARLQKAFPRVRVTNLYGPTECSIGCVAHVVDASIDDEIPIGRPIANICVILLDDAGRLAPIGAVGEITIGGAAVGLGYHEDAISTRAAFIPAPFPELAATTLYRTGDLARLRSDGALMFLGRRDDQTKLRGLRVEPVEIERALLDHPEVRDAGVVVERRAGSPDRLVAWISPCLPVDLAAFVRARLPEARVPSRFVVAASLPRSAAGKLDRRALAALAIPAEAPLGAAPASDLERRIAAIWSELLGLEGAPVDRGFFDLGGHSLLAVRAHRLLERELGRAIPLIDLFTYPTIRALARHLDGAVPGSPLASPDLETRAAALSRQRRRRRGEA
jgi:amino acid adenylation domain-containing protein